MRLEDLAISAAIAAALTLVVLTLRAYRAPLAHAYRTLFDGVRRFGLWQVAGVLFGIVLLYTYLNSHAYRSGYFFLLLVAGAAVAFTITWVREFLFLMSLRDEDLPGRFDKPIWAFVLIGLAPLGLFLFRSHRLAHWPEPEPKPRVASNAARELA
jgi:hypothetical protein